VDPRDSSNATLWLALIAIGVPAVLLPYLIQRTPGWQKSVLANGQSAPAVIRQIKDTGMRSGGGRGRAGGSQRFYELTLEVRPAGEAAFVVTFDQATDWRYRSWEARQPGDAVLVKYDPRHPRHVVVTETTPPHGPSPHPGAPAHPPGHGHPPDQAHRLAQDHQPSPEFQAAAAPADLAGELERLSRLRDTGKLTAEEYGAAKRKLLA
jgi:hypothetical protein